MKSKDDQKKNNKPAYVKPSDQVRAKKAADGRQFIAEKKDKIGSISKPKLGSKRGGAHSEQLVVVEHPHPDFTLPPTSTKAGEARYKPLKEVKHTKKTLSRAAKKAEGHFKATGQPVFLEKVDSISFKADLESRANRRAAQSHKEIRQESAEYLVVKRLTAYLKRLSFKDKNEEIAVKDLVNKLTLALKDYAEIDKKTITKGKLSAAEFLHLTKSAVKDFRNKLDLKDRSKVTMVEKLSEAVRYLLNIIDARLSQLTGRNTSDSTHTFGAKLLTGKDHFFNPPASIHLDKLISSFEGALRSHAEKHSIKNDIDPELRHNKP